MAVVVAVALLSAAALGYEILLIRLFSIILWHHFAFMIISLALLGVGASGTFLVFARRWLEPRFHRAFAGFAAAFGISAVACFALAQRVPFNPLEVVWDLGQQAALLQIYLLLALPFFCAATCVGLALSRFRERIGAIYRADLLGAGAGASLVLLALFVLTPEDYLRVLGGLGLAAAAVIAFAGPGPRWPAGLLAALALAVPFAWPGDWIAPQPSPYKGLSLALHVPQARVIAERSSPLGLLSVVESPAVPFRHAPGLSLTAKAGPPPQLGVFTDGDGLTVITRFDGTLAKLAYLDQQTAALPFHLLTRPRTLILGAGGGADVLRALYHAARQVDAVEINPQMADLVRRDYAGFAGRLFRAPGVRLHVRDARSFVEASGARWDLIHVGLLDSFTASAAGVLALKESALYTVEAFEAYIARLEPGGILAITRWLRVPPRDSLKLFATAITALEGLGVAAPGERLALIRSWNTATLMVKNGPLTAEDIAAIRRFAEARSFDVSYYPGMAPEEANRFNRWREPFLFNGTAALLGPGRQRFLEDYKFHIAPATDDRPYFFRFFKWRLLPEVLAIRGRAAMTLLEGGYLIVAATLAQAAIVSALLIVLPLAWIGRGEGAAPGAPGRGRVMVYFLALGLAFLFVEIAFIQRFVLFLGHPLYAISVVLAAFLVFAGLGSGYSARLAEHRAVARMRPISLAVAGIVLFAGVYLAVLPVLFGWLMAESDPVKILVSVVLIAPLAFFMGMPFPLGLRRVADQAPRLVPWAWGVNGCASVLSAVLASLLATHVGFAVVVALAMGLYGIAALAFAR